MRRFDLRRHAPVIVIVLLVERGVSITGAQELILSINGDAQVTTGATSVRVECDDKNGKAIIDTTQPWPFIDEPGYPYPHAHLADEPQNVEGARRCRVLGTDTRLEGKVQ